MTVFVADAIGLLHAMIAMFCVIGFAAICLGTIFGWRCTEHLYFRATHFAVIAFVMLRLLLNVPCPFSELEDHVRGGRATGLAARLAFRGADQQTFQRGCATIFCVSAILGLHLMLCRYYARRTFSASNVP
jgi:hypothetical protein